MTIFAYFGSTRDDLYKPLNRGWTVIAKNVALQITWSMTSPLERHWLARHTLSGWDGFCCRLNMGDEVQFVDRKFTLWITQRYKNSISPKNIQFVEITISLLLPLLLWRRRRSLDLINHWRWTDREKRLLEEKKKLFLMSFHAQLEPGYNGFFSCRIM